MYATLAPMFGGAGLAEIRAELGADFPAVSLGAAALMGAFAIRVGIIGRQVESYALYLACGGLALVGACLAIVAGSKIDVGAMPGIAPSLGPWGAFTVAVGFTGFGLHRAQEELSGAQTRPVYGGFLLLMALGGGVAAYRIARIAAGMQ